MYFKYILPVCLSTVSFTDQGDLGLPGPRGADGAPGKGVPGEKVTVCLCFRSDLHILF